ncbi:tryptophan synthase beta subunit-like PLP-dependent enzyme [Thermothelomyces heterothallicus CBS 202.75]|uniref:tryptophan synthase beta subunit-like PLP-dependent enzyme n=1 Tax=Thermothelomyces heterothallicus CBS 202.75 TaxID=1149848 RepID=UPI0037425540
MPYPSPIYVNRAAVAPAGPGPDKDGTSALPPTETRERHPPPSSRAPALALHRLLPGYAETPLHSLPSVARELGLGHVLLKDESRRFGLPSFKILGASWAVYRAVAEHLQRRSTELDHHATVSRLLDSLRGAGGRGSDSPGVGPPAAATATATGREKGLGLELEIVTCTEGNWGRAVARMAAYLGAAAVVYVPAHVPETTRDLIRGEGAEVRVVEGSYDAAVDAARGAAEGNDGALLVMDIGWEGYETVPQWVVEGYQTMLDELDTQVLRVTGGQPATHAVVPVGCGSIAQAVAQHFKRPAKEPHGGSRAVAAAAAVLGVEPDTAACLRASLETGNMVSVPTQDSIMCGMNCGTLSTVAWPVLRSGVDASVVVSDVEAHRAVSELEALGIQAGPCGASALAALKRACEAEREKLQFSEKSVVILFSTEGRREYTAPA